MVESAESAPKPVSVPVVNTTFVAVASGTSFNLAIDTNGDVWSWGWSEHGVLGNGDDGLQSAVYVAHESNL